MNNATWKAEYSVGDPVIDAQHQQLIATMNELAALIDRQQPRIEDAGRIFGALAIYVLEHFSYEEARLAEAAYPAADLARHKATHIELMRQIRDFQRRVNDGDTAALRDLLPFLTGTWLTEHICDTDRRYVPYLKADAG